MFESISVISLAFLPLSHWQLADTYTYLYMHIHKAKVEAGRFILEMFK